MKNNIYQYLITVLLSAFLLVSCDNYLDVEPKGIQVLEAVQDYNQWLNCAVVMYTPKSEELNLLADNVDNPDILMTSESTTDRIYTWKNQFSEEVKADPLIWADHYRSIYYFNTVLEGIDDAKGSELEKKSLKAEALLGRAFEYLYLVNIYGKPYNSSSANEDLSVPFVTSNDINDPVPLRSTVQEIYNHIITDITTAIPDLPQDNSQNRFRGSIAAAYSVLARVYLYMGNYTKASQNAQLALDNGPNNVMDFNEMFCVYDMPELLIRSDAIYARFTSNLQEIPSLAYLQSFDMTDLRLLFFFFDYPFSPVPDQEAFSLLSRGEVMYSRNAYPNRGTSVAEMRLIIAETAARANDLSSACNELDLIRKCRILSDSYVKYVSNNQEDVLQKVLQERAFEFPYCGMRWFDMRRLDAEGRMQAVNRHDGSGNIIATLSPGSPKYTLQIPIQVLYYNPDWPQNLWAE